MSLIEHTCGSSNYLNSTFCSPECFEIESVQSFKYLGIEIDLNLNWKKHLLSLKNHSLLVLRKIYRLKSYCTKKLLLNVYYALAHSKFQYGITSWGGTYYDGIEPILLAQKHIIKVIFSKKRRFSCWNLFKENKILPIRHLYAFKCLKEFFMRSGYRITNANHLYKLRSNRQNFTRTPMAHKQHFKNFFAVKAPRYYNCLPIFIRTIRTKSIFLKNVKKWLLTIDYKDFECVIN